MSLALRILLPNLVIVETLIASGLFYWITRRWGPRLYWIQSLASALLLGQIIAHSFVFEAEFALRYGFFFVLCGVVLVRLTESIIRACSANVGERLVPSDTDVLEDDDLGGVNPKTKEQDEYVGLQNIGSKEAVEQEWQAEYKRRSNRKRQFMLVVVVLGLVPIALLNGLVITVAHTIPIYICFIANVLLQYLLVASASVHAGFHTTENKSRRIVWWIVLTVTWCVIAAGSSVPFAIHLDPAKARSIMDSVPLIVTYWASTGALLRGSYYYEKHLYQYRGNTHIFIDSATFVVALAASAALGFFL